MREEYKVIVESVSGIVASAPVKTANPGGRPRKYKSSDKARQLSIKLTEKEILFLKEYGGKYDGVTGYVTHLVREEMKRLGK